MPPRKLSPGITDLGGGRYRVRISAGYDPVTGKRAMFDETIRDSTPDDAERLRATFLLRRGDAPRATDMTLDAFFVDYYWPHCELQILRGKMRRKTLLEDKARYAKRIRPVLGGVRMSKLTRFVLQRWLGSLATAGLSPKTQYHHYSLVHHALEVAVEGEVIKKQPLKKADRPHVPKKRQVVYTAEQANQLLDAACGSDVEAAIIVTLSCWLRRCELAALEWSDFTFWTETVQVDDRPVKVDRATVNIWRGLHQRNREVWFENDTKTEESKGELPLPGWAIPRLKELRGIGPISVKDGKHMPPNTLSYRFTRVAKRAGLPHIPLKNLRHTGATLAIEDHVELKAVSERLRHTSTRTTETIYVNTGTDYAQAVADAGGRWRSTHRDAEARSTHRDAQNG